LPWIDHQTLTFFDEKGNLLLSIVAGDGIEHIQTTMAGAGTLTKAFILEANSNIPDWFA